MIIKLRVNVISFDDVNFVQDTECSRL